MEKLKYYLLGYMDIYAYCLMPNHFHLIIKIKEEENITNPKRVANPLRVSNIDKGKELSSIISNQFSKLFNGYAQAINKQQQRMGSLFVNRFKRILVSDEIYLRKLIHYVHFNPVKHGFGNEIEGWKFFSYDALLSDQQTWLSRERVMELFENKENFKYCHSVEPGCPV